MDVLESDQETQFPQKRGGDDAGGHRFSRRRLAEGAAEDRSRFASGAKPIKGRPGAKLPKADFAKTRKELEGKVAGDVRDVDVLSYLLYPQVFLDFQKHVRLYDNTAVLPTTAFFYGLQSGEEISVEIEPGKTLIVKYLTTGDARDDGTRTVFFELNGQPREVVVADRSREATMHRHPKADPDNPNHVAAPMPGKVSSVAVAQGPRRKSRRALAVDRGDEDGNGGLQPARCLGRRGAGQARLDHRSGRSFGCAGRVRVCHWSSVIGHLCVRGSVTKTNDK